MLVKDMVSSTKVRLVMFTNRMEDIGTGKGVERLRVKSWQFSIVIDLNNVCKRRLLLMMPWISLALSW